jgi:hypothetical protein
VVHLFPFKKVTGLHALIKGLRAEKVVIYTVLFLASRLATCS